MLNKKQNMSFITDQNRTIIIIIIITQRHIVMINEEAIDIQQNRPELVHSGCTVPIYFDNMSMVESDWHWPT